MYFTILSRREKENENFFFTKTSIFRLGLNCFTDADNIDTYPPSWIAFYSCIIKNAAGLIKRSQVLFTDIIQIY